MHKIIAEINKRLDSLDFDGLWKGFARYGYALYDNEYVYFSDNKVIKADNRVLGNKGNFFVCGYDPMNMVRYENMALHKRFAFVDDGSDNKFIKGPVITVSKEENYKE